MSERKAMDFYDKLEGFDALILCRRKTYDSSGRPVKRQLLCLQGRKKASRCHVRCEEMGFQIE